MKKTSSFQNGLIWFGAAVSIAEILTGTYFAPLGFTKGLLAILLGHVIGCAMFFFAGLIGGRTGLSAMGTVELSFGRIGCLFFAALNVLQLVGWTSIMIYDGALATNTVLGIGKWVWCLVIDGLIVLWIAIGIKNLALGQQDRHGRTVHPLDRAVRGRFSRRNARHGAGRQPELRRGSRAAVAMPLSWLPLISDYTREAEKPFAATLSSTLTYGVVSCWMYLIGMGAAIFTGEGDIALIMVKAGLGVAALLILILSTVTTTFLDAYSAGISAESLSKKINGKYAALIVTVIGTVCAICFPMDDITNFLYLIGSVFAPMIAIQITDFFLLRRGGARGKLDVCNAVVWVLGFALYRVLMNVDIPVGNTLPDMAATMLLCVIAHKLVPDKTKAA